MQKLKEIYVHLGSPTWYLAALALWLLVFFSFLSVPAFAVTRFQSRQLFVYNNNPGATTKYKISFVYTSTSTDIGSIDLLFCTNPIPTLPCYAPAGLDVSAANLTEQSGETGFSITQRSPNHLVLSRTPSPVSPVLSVYMLENVVNPSDTSDAFALRMADYASTDASGTLIDLGSVLSAVGEGIVIETQVPPILIFCVAHQVSQDCTDSSGGNYTDLGEVSTSHPLTATSQMAAGTNASGGYSIAVYGNTLTAELHEIKALNVPTPSAPGNNQFGINLRENSAPGIGQDPDGAFTNAQPATSYDIPNKFTYHNGDTVAGAPNVSLVRRFTVSYLLNASPDLHPGIYTSTFTYICSGRF